MGDMEIINTISELIVIAAMGIGLILLAMIFSLLMAQLASKLFEG